MNNQIKVTFNNGEEGIYNSGVTLLELSKYYQDEVDNPILAAKINNIVYPLSERIKTNCQVDFIDVNDINGQSMYLAALKFILYVAIKELYGVNSDIYYLNSLDKGLYSEVKIDKKLTEEEIKKIKETMQEIIDSEFQFEKIILLKKEAVNFLKRENASEKAQNIQNLPNSSVIFYKLKTYYNYFYINLPHSTGVINKFDVSLIDDNHLLLRYPTARSNDTIPEYHYYKETLSTFEKYRTWLKGVNASYVSELNCIVSKGKIRDLIMMNKLFLDRQFSKAVEEIVAKRDKIKVICIAGPSSSGKTTSSLKLCLHLKAEGLNPIVISADNYYKERVDSPKDENGEYDFECFEALDMELFNKDLKKLYNGEEVVPPKFNFYSGKKEWKGAPIRIKENDILILEGLHCLNKEFTKAIPEDAKYKIYVSPFIAMRIDRHNHISTVDLRLLRRIVRDNVYRGITVSDTIKTWQKVRRGEENFIFPYQDDADLIINTASTYDIGILKVYAEPLLYSVPVNSPYYEEARRLLGYLRIYYPIPSENVPVDSVLREFIGGSIFDPH